MSNSRHKTHASNSYQPGCKCGGSTVLLWQGKASTAPPRGLQHVVSTFNLTALVNFDAHRPNATTTHCTKNAGMWASIVQQAICFLATLVVEQAPFEFFSILTHACEMWPIDGGAWGADNPVAHSCRDQTMDPKNDFCLSFRCGIAQ